MEKMIFLENDENMGNNQKQVYLVYVHLEAGTFSNQVKNTPHNPWLAEWTFYLFLTDNGIGATGYDYYGWFSTVFGIFLLNHWPIVYIGYPVASVIILF